VKRNTGPSLQLQRRFVSEIELEQFTGISRRTWQKHRLLNHGPRYYKIHGSIRYDLEEVLNWIRTLAVASEQTASDSHSGALA
jgi:predicted DNA-binding transcriptional regulator AlpA